ncbi:DgyrCDS6470 [Dimorphilus gyrociliatus]|uniref:DgyrCDS6470 n=1 Tax=Dimorphilus gyrociliatus TaxID=2664684 RepID=A0A7I8VSX6_9ANNE|nr:DgyrCDS6470 [Dimorphilus gyrociliatus]
MEPSYRCKLPPNTLPNESIPISEDGNGLDKCSVYTNYSNADLTNKTEKCPNGTSFSGSVFSIVNEWDLTCDKAYLVELSQTILVVGVIVGAMLCSSLSDRFGRKVVFLSSMLAESVLGCLVTFMPNYYSFAVVRFFIGVVQQGMVVAGFVYLCEIFPASKRTIPALFMQIFWAIAICVLSLIGYSERNWKNFMYIISVPLCVALPLFWFLPSSLPWLVAKKRYEQIQNYVNKVEKYNRIALPEDLQNVRKSYEGKGNEALIKGGDDSSNYTILDLFKSSKLRLNCLIMCYIWCVNSLVYYGLSLSTSSLAGDPYLNFFLSGLVEIPAYIVSAFALQYFGRRWPICIFHTIAGMSLLIAIFLPGGRAETVLSMIGKFGITGSFGCIFLWTPEIVPTTLRSQGIGIASVGGRAGNIVAPFSSYVVKVIPWLPGVIFGGMSLVAAVLTLFLPETLNRPLPQTIEEVEGWTRTLTKEEKMKAKARELGRNEEEMKEFQKPIDT